MTDQYDDILIQFDNASDDSTRSMLVYAVFGLAVYVCQVLERGLLNLGLAGHRVLYPDEHGESLDQWEEQIARKTMGQMLNQIRRDRELAENDLAHLQIALQHRNQIMHGYFAARATGMFGRSKQREIIVDLLDRIRAIRKADGIVDEQTVKTLSQLGPTTEAIKHWLAGETEKLMQQIAELRAED